jgi:hypothetical protein
MDRKTLFIGILSFTAVLLLVAALMPLPQAKADFSIKDRDYQMVTVLGQMGSSVCYVIDRKGRVAIFCPDMRNPGQYQIGRVGNLGDMFAGMGK